MKLSNRIVGGQLTTIERFPYQVFLQANHYFCGGAILSKTVVITAAHCATGPPRNLIVFAGITYLSERRTSYRYRVEQYFIHDQYVGRTTPEYDVAILRLSTSLAFGSKIQSIALPTKTYEEGQQAVASGWGQTEVKPSSNQLRYINLIVGQSPKCKARDGAICTFDETKSVCKVRLQIRYSANHNNKLLLWGYKTLKTSLFWYVLCEILPRTTSITNHHRIYSNIFSLAITSLYAVIL